MCRAANALGVLKKLSSGKRACETPRYQLYTSDIFFAVLDLEQKSSFLNRHWLGQSNAGMAKTAIAPFSLIQAGCLHHMGPADRSQYQLGYPVAPVDGKCFPA
jgi:hypothetical protein